MGKDWDRLDPGIGAERLRDRSSFTPHKSEFKQGVGTNIGAPKKNPRCRRCGKLRFDWKPCACDTPNWDTRTAEYAREMQKWHHLWAREALRVLKSGGHLLAFGGTRTAHRLTCALEDAGFEIRDTLAWLYGSGFPKSLDVSRAIDRAAGAEREVVGDSGNGRPNRVGIRSVALAQAQTRGGWITAPATEDAHRWSGFGTSLKPAHEPIVLARKPLSEGNVAANVLRWSTGALNIDGCRVGNDGATTRSHQEPYGRQGRMDQGGGQPWRTGHAVVDLPAGRWPANVVLSHDCPADGCEPDCPVRLLDEQSGEREAGARPAYRSAGTAGYHGWPSGTRDGGRIEFDSGGASRYFATFRYEPKASRSERNAGLEGMPLRIVNDDTPPGTLGSNSPRAGAGRLGPVANYHPTVKPVALMRWLCRLITPKAGVVLDPFMGSGSTGCACALEGFRFVGIEREREYFELARRRIAWWACHPAEDLDEAQEDAPAPVQAGQLSLFGAR